MAKTRKIKYDEILIIKIPKKLKEALQERAELNSQTVSDYLRVLINNDLREI